MGSPQQPTAEQIAELKKAGGLKLAGSPQWIRPSQGQLQYDVELPPQSVTLLRLTWREP
jgi:xylan 1,4-beta-xylosidase